MISAVEIVWTLFGFTCLTVQILHILLCIQGKPILLKTLTDTVARDLVSVLEIYFIVVKDNYIPFRL